MNDKTGYNTRHRERIIDIFLENKGKYISARDIIGATFSDTGAATVYRILKRLSDDGIIEKKIDSTASGAFYRYAEPDNCGCRFHLHCTVCGKMIHMDCHEMFEAEQHIMKSHSFTPSDDKTIINGLCNKCSDKLSH